MSLIDEVLDRLNIDIVKEFVPGEFRKKGHDWVGQCPSGHSSDSGQSFQINESQPTFKCWNCEVSGNWIHLYEFVKFNRCSCGQGFTDSFKQALYELADILSIDTSVYQKNNAADQVYGFLDVIQHEYQRSMTDEHYDYLFKKYGWKKENIKSERIGYCNSDFSSLSEILDTADLLSTGLFLIDKSAPKKIRPIYEERFVFPYIIGGRVKYTIGRQTEKTPDLWKKPPSKYVKHNLFEEQKKPYIAKIIKNEVLRYQNSQDYIIISEGIADFYSLKFAGYNTISAVTTSFKLDDYNYIIEILKKVGKVYIANDNEKNHAGLKGAERISEKLIEGGINPLIVLLPIPDGSDKMDVAEFLRINPPAAFDEVVSKSQSFIDMKINEISPDIDKSILTASLHDVLEYLSYMPAEIVEIFIHEKIAKRFKITGMKTFITALKNKIIAIGELRSGKKQNKSDDLFSEDHSNIRLISAGQDWSNGNLYYTVTRPGVVMDKKGFEKIINRIFVVGSDRTIRELRDGQIIDSRFAIKNKLSPEYKSDKWNFSGDDFSIDKFIAGQVTINPADLFFDIRKHFDRFIFFKMEGISDHLAVMIMASYLYMMFHSIGYIHFWAEKRSGKTTAMELLYELGFNARMSSSISDAAIFRSIENHRPLLLIDEAEHLNPTPRQRENGVQNERLELFKSGYKKAGMATRCEGQNNIVMDFSNYCIKVFASIKTLDSTLEDRTIIHEFKRAKSDAKIEEWRPDKTRDDFFELRNKLHCFALQYAPAIFEKYQKLDDYLPLLEAKGIKFRNRELWGPYLAISLLIDDFNPGNSIFGRMLDIAEYTIKNKEAFNKDSKALIILEKFYQWVNLQYQGNLTTPIDGIFLRTTIIEGFINSFIKQDEDEDLSFVTYPVLKDILRKFDVIDASSEISKIRVGARQGKALRIINDKILDALVTYKTDFAEDVQEDIDKYKARLKTEEAD